MRGETVGYVDQFVSEHGNQCRRRGKVGMKMRHRFAQQFMGKGASLEKVPENNTSTKAQCLEKCSTVTAGLPAN